MLARVGVSLVGAEPDTAGERTAGTERLPEARAHPLRQDLRVHRVGRIELVARVVDPEHRPGVRPPARGPRAQARGFGAVLAAVTALVLDRRGVEHDAI